MDIVKDTQKSEKNPEKKFYFFFVKWHKIAKYAKIAIFGRNLTKVGENHR